MRGPTNAATGDLIVEPIEEAVALYDNLLKELEEFIVSHLFLGISPSARIEPIRAPFKVDEIAFFPIAKHHASFSSCLSTCFQKLYSKLLTELC
jgi:hypothetical protein